MSVPSVKIAKDRLKTLLIAEHFTKDVYLTISKYIELKPEDFHVKINRSDIQILLTGERN